MPVRLLDFFDIASLSKYRDGLVPLNTARFLIRGSILGFSAIFPALDANQELATAVCNENGDKLLGQVTRNPGSHIAGLSFISPEESPSSLQLEMVEFLIAQAGGWGCYSLLAEVEEDSPVFKILRQAGFSVYAWQRVWKLNGIEKSQDKKIWFPPKQDEILTIQSLYSQIVPVMMQSVEPLPSIAEGLICKQGGDIQAHISLTYGTNGIWAQPLIHPDANSSPEWFNSMISSIPNTRKRPVYLCVRSYQAWLENMLEDQGASAGNRQAVMVRHLTVRKSLQQITNQAKNVEPVWANPATPLSHYQPVESNGTRNE